MQVEGWQLGAKKTELETYEFSPSGGRRRSVDAEILMSWSTTSEKEDSGGILFNPPTAKTPCPPSY